MRPHPSHGVSRALPRTRSPRSLLGAALVGLLALGGAPVRAEDPAESWVRVSKGLVALGVDAVRLHPKAAGDMWANVYGQGAMRSKDGGETWTRMMKAVRPLPGARDPVRITLDPLNPKVLYLVTLGRVYRSEDQGETWEPISSGLTSYSWSGKQSAELVYDLVINPKKSVHLLAGTRTDGEWNGGLFESNDSGQKWSQIAGTNVKGSDLGADAWPIVLSHDTDKIVLVGGRVGVWFSDDRGRKFKRVDPGGIGQHDVRDITDFIPSSKDVYIADARGVWGSNDQGETWSKKPLLDGNAVCVAVDPHQKKRLYAVLHDRGLFVSEDARHQKWTELGHADLEITGLAFHPKDRKVLVASSHVTGLHVSKDEGKTFTAQAGGLTGATPAVCAAGVSPKDGTHLAVTEHGVVFASTDRGQAWKRVGRLGQACRGLRCDPLGAWYASGARLLKSEDGGATWSVAFLPADPEDNVADLQVGPDGKLWLLLERSLSVQASADGGKTWAPAGNVAAAGNCHAVALAVDARSSNHLVASTRSAAVGLWSPKDDQGGPYESFDGGKTWAPLRDGLFEAAGGKPPPTGWNRGGPVAVDPVHGTLLYAAQGAGLFARAPAAWKDGKPPVEPWVNLARWEVQSPTIAALCITVESGESRVLVQASGETATRALVLAQGAALLDAVGTLKGGQELKQTPWDRKPDARARLSGLVADPQVPGRYVAGDLGEQGGVLIFERPGAAPPAPAPEAPKPAPEAPKPAPEAPKPGPDTVKPVPPAGLLGFSASADHSVGVWNLAGGASQTYLRGHTGEVLAVALAPDESVLATGGRDKTLRLWGGADGAPRATVPVDGVIQALLFSADARTVFVGLEETFAVLAVDVATQAVRKLEGHTGGVVALCLAGDGTLWSAGRDRTLRAWDVAGGKPGALKVDLPAEPLSIVKGADGKRIYVVGKEALLRAFSTEDGKEQGTAVTLPDPLASCAVAAPTGSLVYVGGMGKIVVVDGATMAVKATWTGPTLAVTALAVSRDGTWLLGGDAESGLWLWETVGGTTTWSKAGAHTGPILGLTLTPDVAPPPAPAGNTPPGPSDAPPAPAPAPAPAPGPGPAPAPGPTPAPGPAPGPSPAPNPGPGTPQVPPTPPEGAGK